MKFQLLVLVVAVLACQLVSARSLEKREVEAGAVKPTPQHLERRIFGSLLTMVAKYVAPTVINKAFGKGLTKGVFVIKLAPAADSRTQPILSTNVGPPQHILVIVGHLPAPLVPPYLSAPSSSLGVVIRPAVGTVTTWKFKHPTLPIM
ncbi:hypothetical protein H4R33_005972 [Dimargaris cristalligena]|nr:hypothetical protein H4R33_005972 [Dimargaris cristalligena]